MKEEEDSNNVNLETLDWEKEGIFFFKATFFFPLALWWGLVFFLKTNKQTLTTIFA